ncbi:hypothetical protein PGB90_006462 [Kerria lacca]
MEQRQKYVRVMRQCPFCSGAYKKLSVHLENMHKDEDSVRCLASASKSERRRGFALLTGKGILKRIQSDRKRDLQNTSESSTNDSDDECFVSPHGRKLKYKRGNSCGSVTIPCCFCGQVYPKKSIRRHKCPAQRKVTLKMCQKKYFQNAHKKIPRIVRKFLGSLR